MSSEIKKALLAFTGRAFRIWLFRYSNLSIKQPPCRHVGITTTAATKLSSMALNFHHAKSRIISLLQQHQSKSVL
jgi:hypothetical protein